MANFGQIFTVGKMKGTALRQANHLGNVKSLYKNRGVLEKERSLESIFVLFVLWPHSQKQPGASTHPGTLQTKLGKVIGT